MVSAMGRRAVAFLPLACWVLGFGPVFAAAPNAREITFPVFGIGLFAGIAWAAYRLLIKKS